MDEIPDVRTFYWHFEQPQAQEKFHHFRPGQFAQVTLFGAGEFPASLPPSPTEAETFFTVRRVGSCTAALHALKPGDAFAVRGPYGNGFPMDEYYGRNLLFMAGGIGLIPLRSCIVYALAHRAKFERILVCCGAKSPQELLYLGELRQWQAAAELECHPTVDRPAAAWTGHVGVVGSLLKQPEVRVPVENTVAFVCGPPVMFRFVIQDLLEMGFAETTLIASSSISDVPLFNGFASKWTIYVATIQGSSATPYLAICGFLAILTSVVTRASFIKFFGASFLSRTSCLVQERLEAKGKLEVQALMQLPQLCLATLCLGLGIFPFAAYRFVGAALGASSGGLGQLAASALSLDSSWLGLSGLQSDAFLGPPILLAVLAGTLFLVRFVSKLGGARALAVWLRARSGLPSLWRSQFLR